MMHGIELPPYEPSQTDLLFTLKLVRSLKVGGKWGIPRCSIFYEKVGHDSMKLENFLLPKLAEHMIEAGLVFEGMEPHESVEALKQAQAQDHHAFKACCKLLDIAVDDSILDGAGCR